MSGIGLGNCLRVLSTSGRSTASVELRNDGGQVVLRSSTDDATQVRSGEPLEGCGPAGTTRTRTKKIAKP